MNIPPSMEELFASAPLRLADIGARGGWQRKWLSVANHILFVGFEPESREYARLVASAGSNEVYSSRALYHTQEQVIFHHTRDPATSSIYPPNTTTWNRIVPNDQRLEVVQQQAVNTQTLDRELKRLEIGGLDFIKLDTQGSELDILRGAENALTGDVLGVEVEVEFMELYEGQPLFPDVHAFLAKLGYELMDFPTMTTLSSTRHWRRRGGRPGWLGRIRSEVERLSGPRGDLRGAKQLLYADAIYLRRASDYLDVVQPERNRRVFVGVLTAVVLEHYEFALDLIEIAASRDSLGESDEGQLKRFVHRSARAPRRLLSDVARIASRVALRLQRAQR